VASMAVAKARCSANGSHPSASADSRSRRVRSSGTAPSPTAAPASAPAQVLGPLHRIGAQREGQRGGGQHREIVIAPGRSAGQRREHASGADPVEVGVQQHRAGVAAGVAAGADPGPELLTWRVRSWVSGWPLTL
jgi:hypothetical protein